MQINDPWDMVSYHQQDLLAEAESERLLSTLPERPPLQLRHKLAMACRWLAGRWTGPAHERVRTAARAPLWPAEHARLACYAPIRGPAAPRRQSLPAVAPSRGGPPLAS